MIYGANASGKSNILLAFKALEYLIKESSNFKPKEEIGPYEPFKLDKESKHNHLNNINKINPSILLDSNIM